MRVAHREGGDRGNCIDSVEGFDGYHKDSLYHRVPTTVDAGDGRVRPAWTYVLADPDQTQPVITSGNWRQHLGHYQSFMQSLLETHCGDDEGKIIQSLASRIPFSMGGDHDEVVQSLTPLLESFIDGTVSERRLAQQTGTWVCLPRQVAV